MTPAQQSAHDVAVRHAVYHWSSLQNSGLNELEIALATAREYNDHYSDEMLRHERAAIEAAAFQRGAEAMREAAVKHAQDVGIERWHGSAFEEVCAEVGAAIRALSLPPYEGDE